MRVSRKKLDRAIWVIRLYILFSIGFVVSVLVETGEFMDSILLSLVTMFTVFVYRFMHKFLRRYQNFNDRYHIINWIIILIVIHNSYSIFRIGYMEIPEDVLFVIKVFFILISVMLFVYYLALYNNLNNMSTKHFGLIKPFSYSYIIVPLVMILSAFFMLLAGGDVMDIFSKNYPSLVLSLIQLIPFIILIQIYKQAKYVRD